MRRGEDEDEEDNEELHVSVEAEDRDKDDHHDHNNEHRVHSHLNKNSHNDEDFGGLPTVAATEVDHGSKGETSISVIKNDQDGPGYFGPRRKRIIVFCGLLLWVCIFVIPRWDDYDRPQPLGDAWVDAYKLHLGGIAIICIAVLIEFVVKAIESHVSCCENRLLKIIVGGSLVLGGFIYWVGGIQLAKSINDIGRKEDETHRYYLSGWAGTVFIEATFVALLAMALGIDVISNLLKRSERIRIYLVWNTILAFTALVAFFSYAAWRGYYTDKLHDVLELGHLTMSKTACVAAGWFFVFLGCMYWYAMEFADICCKCSATARAWVRDKPEKVKSAGLGLFLFGAFLVMIGMWSMGTASDKKWNCYYVGYGFFIFFFCCIMVLDIYLGHFIQERRSRINK